MFFSSGMWSGSDALVRTVAWYKPSSLLTCSEIWLSNRGCTDLLSFEDRAGTSGILGTPHVSIRRSEGWEAQSCALEVRPLLALTLRQLTLLLRCTARHEKHVAPLHTLIVFGRWDG